MSLGLTPLAGTDIPHPNGWAERFPASGPFTRNTEASDRVIRSVADSRSVAVAMPALLDGRVTAIAVAVAYRSAGKRRAGILWGDLLLDHDTTAASTNRETSVPMGLPRRDRFVTAETARKLMALAVGGSV